jgi:hypothetical protein
LYKFYYLFQTCQENATEAEATCIERNMQLVSLDTEEKHNKICQHLMKNGLRKKIRASYYNLGLTTGQGNVIFMTSLESRQEGKFTWILNGGTHIRWCPNQPISTSSAKCGGVVDCCIKAINCDQPEQFICEEA